MELYDFLKNIFFVKLGGVPPEIKYACNGCEYYLHEVWTAVHQPKIDE